MQSEAGYDHSIWTSTKQGYADHDITAAYQQGKVQQVHIKNKAMQTMI